MKIIKFLIAVFGIAALMLTSCTKVRENKFVGKWKVQYKTIGVNADDIVFYDNWYILFFEDNTYASNSEYDNEIDKEGFWFYDLHLNELTMGGKCFTVEKRGNKELALYTADGRFSCYVLKKEANF